MDQVEQGSPAKSPPKIGSYQLIQPLGAGGMSSVFKARHIESGLEVAIKILPRNLAKNPTLLQRFLREARSAESLEHPNIVSIYDRGVDQGRHYLVLEYVPGGDLHDRVKRGGPLPLPEAVSAIRSICTGLQFAAARGLVHRDIKPANLLMLPSGEVKIIDLGLALQAEAEDERVTREGTTVGTVDYMSPEQARDSRATSEQSDIYSLGCTFYFLLTGSPPFPGGDIADKLTRHCQEPAPDVRTLRPAVPAPLAALVRKMMAKKPANRFSNYQELIDSLDRISAKEVDASPMPNEGGEVLFAIIDEDDSEDNTSPGREKSEPLFALIDESDPGLPSLAPEPTPTAASSLYLPPLADLAEFEEERTPRTCLPSQPVPRPAPLSRAKVREMITDAILEPEVEEVEEEEQYDNLPPIFGSRRYQDPTRKLVLTYSLIGLGVFFFIVGVHQLYLASVSQPTFEVQSEATEDFAPASRVLLKKNSDETRPARPAKSKS